MPLYVRSKSTEARSRMEEAKLSEMKRRREREELIRTRHQDIRSAAASMDAIQNVRRGQRPPLTLPGDGYSAPGYDSEQRFWFANPNNSVTTSDDPECKIWCVDSARWMKREDWVKG
jgi:hypothetical protein